MPVTNDNHFFLKKILKNHMCICRMPVLTNVTALSDDENDKLNTAVPKPGPAKKGFLPRRRRRPARGRITRVVTPADNGQCSPKHLANLIRGKCGCKCECFRAFDENQIQEWMKLRKMMARMKKLEKDQYVWVLLNQL